MNTQVIFQKSKLNIGAGVLLLIYGTYHFFLCSGQLISCLVHINYYYDGSYFIIHSILNLISIVSRIVTGIILLTGKRSKALVVFVSLPIVISLLSTFYNSIYHGFQWDFVLSYILPNANILLFVIAFSCLIGKPNKFAKIAWVFPGSIMILSTLFNYINTYIFNKMLVYLSLRQLLVSIIPSILFSILFYTAVFLFSRWLAYPETKTSIPYNQPQPTAPQFTPTPTYSHQQNTNLGVADELMKFKNLLDSGVITQEEYDIHKKKLLG